MAVRFAVANGNWNTGATWDNGSVPVAGDTVYSNGFTVTVDTDINIESLRNSSQPVVLPNMSIPLMTSNTAPSGTVSSSNSSFSAYLAFDKVDTTGWVSGTTNGGWISYDYGSNKLIKRYYIRGGNISGNSCYPTSWNFEGYNTSTSSWDILEAKTGMGTAVSSGYTSALLTHTTQYSNYRINILAVSPTGFPPSISTFEMTESTLSTFGTGVGGTFSVPSTLSGARTITQTGTGIIGNGAAVITLSHNGTNIVNLNTVVGGYIVNTAWYSGAGGIAINHTGTGILNINGDLWGFQGTTVGYQLYSLQTTSSSTINLIGNLYSPRVNNSTICHTINCAGAGATFNITGNLIVTSIATTYFNQHCFYTTASSVTVNLTGNATGNTGNAIFHNGANGAVNIIGTITTTNNSSSYAINITVASTILNVSTPIINVGNLMAINSYRIVLNNVYSNSWAFVDQNNTSRALTYGTPVTGPYPAEADVRYNVAYGASPTRYGTCRVPAPQYVSQGVLVDSTIGTAYLSASDVWNVLTSTITTSGSIGERLKNASTVQTTGDQIASYQV